MKNRFFSLFAAAAVVLSLSACKPSETAQETQTSEESAVTVSETVQTTETTAPENAEVVYETLAEGQERDWKIEDVLKNDLEIDGIPISLPCTVEELLNTLGEGYSVNEEKLVYEGEYVTSSKYYTGEYNCIRLFYNGESKLLLDTIAETENVNIQTAYVIGFFPIGEMITIDKLSDMFNVDSCIKKYGLANEVSVENNKTQLLYYDDVGMLSFVFKNDRLTKTYAFYMTEEKKMDEITSDNASADTEA